MHKISQGKGNRSNLLWNCRWRNGASREEAGVNGGGERACCRSFWRSLRRHPRPDLPPCPFPGSGCQATAWTARPTAFWRGRDCNHHCFPPTHIFNLCSERASLFPFGEAGGVRSRSSGCSVKEESSCSAGEFVEEATPSARSLCEAGKRFAQKGPVLKCISSYFYCMQPYS